MINKIKFTSRRKEYSWLSNFYESPMIINGVIYKTNEHFYQSQKYKDVTLKEWIILSPKPRFIKSLSNGLRFYDEVDNWKEIKFDVMLKGLREKFSQNEELKQKLLSTEDCTLHEDSRSKTWGITGDDRLGKLLMEVRQELK